MLRRSSLVLAVALAAISSPAQQPLARLFPSNSYGWLSFAGLSACREAAQRMPAVELVERSLRRAGPSLIDQIPLEHVDTVLRRLQQRLQRVGLDVATLRELLQGPLAIGIGRPTFFGEGVTPSFCMALQIGGHEAAADRLLGALHQGLQRLGVDRSEQRRVEGVDVTVLQSSRMPGAVAHARIGDHLLLCNSLGYLRDCLGAVAGRVATLADDESFGTAQGALDNRGLVDGYVDVRPLGATIEPWLPYEVRDVAAAIGLTDLRSIGLTAGVRGGASVDAVHAAVTAPEDGMLRAMFGRGVDFDDVALCPEDTFVLATTAIDIDAGWHAWQRLMAALPEAVRRELGEEVHEELGRELRHLDLEPHDLGEALHGLGPDITLAVTTPTSGGPVPELIVLVDVRDREPVQALLDHLRERLPPDVLRSTDYEGTTIHYTNELRHDHVPFSPAIAVTDQRLIVASSVQTLKGVLARAAGKRPGLDVETAFGQRIQGPPPAAFALVRVKDALAPVWGMLQGLAERAAIQADLDPAVVPTLGEVTNALFDSEISLRLDADAILLRQEQTLGLGGTIAVFGMLLDRALAGELGAPASEQPRVF